MINEIKKDAQTRMHKSIESLRHDLAKVRTGRATTALVDHIKVNSYGSDMPLSQVATLEDGFEDGIVWHRNRLPTITVRADLSQAAASRGLTHGASVSTMRVPARAIQRRSTSVSSSSAAERCAGGVATASAVARKASIVRRGS